MVLELTQTHVTSSNSPLLVLWEDPPSEATLYLMLCNTRKNPLWHLRVSLIPVWGIKIYCSEQRQWGNLYKARKLELIGYRLRVSIPNMVTYKPERKELSLCLG